MLEGLLIFIEYLIAVTCISLVTFLLVHSRRANQQRAAEAEQEIGLTPLPDAPADAARTDEQGVLSSTINNQQRLGVRGDDPGSNIAVPAATYPRSRSQRQAALRREIRARGGKTVLARPHGIIGS